MTALVKRWLKQALEGYRIPHHEATLLALLLTLPLIANAADPEPTHRRRIKSPSASSRSLPGRKRRPRAQLPQTHPLPVRRLEHPGGIRRHTGLPTGPNRPDQNPRRLRPRRHRCRFPYAEGALIDGERTLLSIFPNPDADPNDPKSYHFGSHRPVDRLHQRSRCGSHLPGRPQRRLQRRAARRTSRATPRS